MSAVRGYLISEHSVSQGTSHVLVCAQILQPIFTSLPSLASSTPSMRDPPDLMLEWAWLVNTRMHRPVHDPRSNTLARKDYLG